MKLSMGGFMIVFFSVGSMSHGSRLQAVAEKFHHIVQPTNHHIKRNIPSTLRLDRSKTLSASMRSDRSALRLIQNDNGAIGSTIAHRTAPPVAAVSSLSSIVASCIVPSCLGFWKNGYTVSYAYGVAMAMGGFLLFTHAEGVALAHAAAYIFYGVRLVFFLMYREIALPESIHQMVNRPASLGMRLKRLPVILGCAFLYFCMLAPLHITASIGLPKSWVAITTVGVMWIGFGVAALGDAVKSVVKAKKGTDALVTVFPFNFLRHPNYTGEFIGWMASFVAALVAVANAGIWKSSIGWLAASAMGTSGIMYVLVEAASGLEKKQKEKYKDLAKYHAWLKCSWSGPSVVRS